MKVTIKERDYDFIPDYPHEWSQSPNGYFKSPVLIGKHKCFLRRFSNKSTQEIPGWELLVRLKYKNENNLPRLYDLVSTEEKHVEVHYVFYEYIKGTSLDIRLESDILIDLERLTNDLFSGLKSLNKYEHWIADFSEKNIFCEDSDRFLVVNLDNALPLSMDPSISSTNIYHSMVRRFYSEILGKAPDELELPGIALNYLQVIFMILRIKIFQQEQQGDYASSQFVDHLPEYLDHVDPAFRSLFTRMATNPEAGSLSFNDTELRELILRRIVNSAIELPEVVAIPEVISFQSSADSVVKNETFTLDWQVKNATHVEIFKNGVSFRKFTSDHTSMAISEFYDGRDKEMVYTLVASNDTGIAESLPVSVKIREASTIRSAPEILSFKCTATAVKDGEIFTLQWEVRNTSFVELYKNGRLFQKFGSDTNTLALSESAQGKKRDIEYTLDAVNESGEKQSESVRIKVEPVQTEVKPVGWVPNMTILKYVGALFAALLIIAFVVFRYFESKPKITYFLPESIAEEHTIIIRGKNFPTEANSFQVLFNNVRGNIQYNTDDLIRVGVPFLGQNLNNGIVRIAVVIKDDTTYASKTLKVNRLHPTPGNFDIRTQEVTGIRQDTPLVAEVKGRPRPVQKKQLLLDTVQSPTPEPEVTEEEPPPAIDIRPLVKLSGNDDFKKKVLGGIKDLELTVRNDSPYDLDQVQVEVTYLKRNEKEMKKEKVVFSNIRAHTSKTMTVPESNRGRKASYRIVSISSRQFEAG